MASGTIKAIGTLYEADWIGTSSTATALTNSLTLPAGTYIIVVNIPVMATEGSGTLAIKLNGVVDTGGYKKMYSYDSKTIIRKLTAQTTVQVVSGASTSVGISYIERGSLKAIKIA